MTIDGGVDCIIWEALSMKRTFLHFSMIKEPSLELFGLCHFVSGAMQKMVGQVGFEPTTIRL